MTARFGRNKRRRAREAIEALQQRTANLEHAHVMDRALLVDQRKRLADARDEIEEARELALAMSPYTVLAPPATIKHPGRSDDEVLIDDPGPMSMSPSAFDDTKMMLRRAPLHVILGSIEEDRMRQMVHARIEFARGPAVAYGISERVLRETPTEQLARLIIKDVAPHLVRELIAARRQGRR